MADSKKRRPNFTEEEVFAMVEAVKDRKHAIMSKFDSTLTAKSKNLAWEAVTLHVNIVSRVSREVAEVRKKFSDFRALVKKKAASGKKHSGGTGGGPAAPVIFTPAEEAMLPLIEQTAVHGLQGVQDSEEMNDGGSSGSQTAYEPQILLGQDLDAIQSCSAEDYGSQLSYEVHQTKDSTSVILLSPQEFSDLHSIPGTSAAADGIVKAAGIAVPEEVQKEKTGKEQPSVKRKKRYSSATAARSAPDENLAAEMLSVQKSIFLSLNQLVDIFQDMNCSIKQLVLLHNK